MIERSCRASEADFGRPPRQRRRDLSRARAPRRQARRRHRPDLGARPAQRLSAGRLDARRVGASGASATRRARSRRRKRSMAVQVEAMLDFWRQGVPTLDYGNNIRQMAQDDGRQGRLRLPGLRAGLYPAAVLPRHRPVPLVRALRRPGGHLPHRRQGEGADPRRSAPAQLARHGARAHRLPGPAGAHLLGRPRPAPPARPRLQRDGGGGRAQGADRHRPRPPRFGLGRQPEPRDRGDAGRLRRGLGLAAAQRAPQLRLGRDLGVAAPRRRRRHGLLPARRHGHRRRRHAEAGAPARARAVERPGDRRDAPRRRRLRGGDRVRAGAWAGLPGL